MGKDINSKGYFYAKVVEQMRCIGCTYCCIACPDSAIEMNVHGTMYRYFRYQGEDG